MTANQYLIVLTASDSVFLTGMILILFKVDYINYPCCVVIEYVLMSSSYVSSWSVVVLTIERYIAIAHPLKHVKVSEGHTETVSFKIVSFIPRFLQPTVAFYSDMPKRCLRP